MSTISHLNKILPKVAIYGGVVSLISVGYFQYKIQDSFRNSDYYKKAITILKNNVAAVELLGEPFKTGRLDLGDTNLNRADGLTAQLTIPIRGSKDCGTLHLQASRIQEGEHWNVDCLELDLMNEKKKIQVYKRNVPFATATS